MQWVEVDFPNVVKQKHQSISEKEPLASIVGPFTFTEGDLISSNYKLFTCDVRDGDILTSKFTANEIDRSIPTLLITECLMIYMTGKDSTSVYNWIRDFFIGDLASINYEMINPDDPFGRMMVSNLEERGCQLLGIADCPSA